MHQTTQFRSNFEIGRAPAAVLLIKKYLTTQRRRQCGSPINLLIMIAEHAGKESRRGKIVAAFCLVVPGPTLGITFHGDCELEVEDQGDKRSLRCVGWN